MRFYSLEKVNSERVCIKILHSMCEKEEWLYEDGKLFIKNERIHDRYSLRRCLNGEGLHTPRFT
ncbi:hypothetical protein bcgnr5378_53790 [Bacillus cereus]|nr:hypothetical protein BCM0060_5243 [Bacillus cereus]BCC14935.1 hypothetical protein BCM0074_5318 [Bacillus cereus]BCC32499.1 hypothetical protein BCM0100_5225 [Bacillus cereus]BCC49970.1 hypothetical protein BCJMU02_5279 [Bacillus cereus]BCC56079.1 hypothetical protein BCJMU07_5429 [Bacillus cereus]